MDLIILIVFSAIGTELNKPLTPACNFVVDGHYLLQALLETSPGAIYDLVKNGAPQKMGC